MVELTSGLSAEIGYQDSLFRSIDHDESQSLGSAMQPRFPNERQGLSRTQLEPLEVECLEDEQQSSFGDSDDLLKRWIHGEVVD
jgi:hypothetical protein